MRHTRDAVFQRKKSSGFTLIEIVVSIAIIVTITTLIFNSYVTFTSRSGLRVRAVEIAEFLRLAQEFSASSVPISASEAVAVERGFQIVRLVVRDGLLKEVRLEEAEGQFSEFSVGTTTSPNAFHEAGGVALKGSRRIALQAQESYFIDACFIDTGITRTYTRIPLAVGANDCSTTPSSYMLCEVPLADSVDAVAIARNSFDVHFSIEQPTREIYANIIPVGTERLYAATEPNGHQLRVSEHYEGIRVMLLTKDGLKSGVDVFTSGFVSTSADDIRDGCPDL